MFIRLNLRRRPKKAVVIIIFTGNQCQSPKQPIVHFWPRVFHLRFSYSILHLQTLYKRCAVSEHPSPIPFELIRTDTIHNLWSEPFLNRSHLRSLLTYNCSHSISSLPFLRSREHQSQQIKLVKVTLQSRERSFSLSIEVFRNLSQKVVMIRHLIAREGKSDREQVQIKFEPLKKYTKFLYTNDMSRYSKSKLSEWKGERGNQKWFHLTHYLFHPPILTRRSCRNTQNNNNNHKCIDSKTTTKTSLGVRQV